MTPFDFGVSRSKVKVTVTFKLKGGAYMFHKHFLLILAQLLRRKSQAIVIARSALPLSCKTFKVLKLSTSNMEYLHIMKRCSFKIRGITLTVIFLELCHLFTKNLK